MPYMRRIRATPAGWPVDPAFRSSRSAGLVPRNGIAASQGGEVTAMNNVIRFAIIGAAVFAGACGSSKPASTQYTKSGNCSGPSVMTLRFAPEPSARKLPGAVWIEECPDGRFYVRHGNEGAWKEITKREADAGAVALRNAGRRFVRVVD
jgi:hypothetical protein